MNNAPGNESNQAMKGILTFVFWGLTIAAIFHLAGTVDRSVKDLKQFLTCSDDGLEAARARLEQVQNPKPVMQPVPARQDLVAYHKAASRPADESFDRLFVRAVHRLGADAKKGTNQLLEDWGIRFEEQ